MLEMQRLEMSFDDVSALLFFQLNSVVALLMK